jgi:hypothetical protein
MIRTYNPETKWYEFYGTQHSTCVFCDQPSTVGYGDACTVVTDDQEYMIRIGINTCNRCYGSKPRSHVNKLIKQKRLEIVQNGEHLPALS